MPDYAKPCTNFADDLLCAAGLGFAYVTGQEVLRDVAISARAGEFICLLGANGSGKTTLLRCLLGLLKPAQGEVKIAGKSIAKISPVELAKLVAYVPQQTNFTNEMRAIDVVLTGRYPHLGGLGFAGADDLEVARLAMEMTETERFADRMISALSGGEAQRVMIARALAQQPAFLLLDEPTSHLDLKHQIGIYKMLRRVAKDWPMGVICISHDVNLASQFADELVFLHSGRVLATGPKEAVLTREVLEECFGLSVEIFTSPAGRVVVCPAEN